MDVSCQFKNLAIEQLSCWVNKKPKSLIPFAIFTDFYFILATSSTNISGKIACEKGAVTFLLKCKRNRCDS